MESPVVTIYVSGAWCPCEEPAAKDGTSSPSSATLLGGWRGQQSALAWTQLHQRSDHDHSYRWAIVRRGHSAGLAWDCARRNGAFMHEDIGLYCTVQSAAVVQTEVRIVSIVVRTTVRTSMESFECTYSMAHSMAHIQTDEPSV